MINSQLITHRPNSPPCKPHKARIIFLAYMNYLKAITTMNFKQSWSLRSQCSTRRFDALMILIFSFHSQPFAFFFLLTFQIRQSIGYSQYFVFISSFLINQPWTQGCIPFSIIYTNHKTQANTCSILSIIRSRYSSPRYNKFNK